MPGIQFDFVIPAILHHGDLEDIVRLVEPASLLILSGAQDKRWSIGIEQMVEYGRAAFRRAARWKGVFIRAGTKLGAKTSNKKTAAAVIPQAAVFF